MTDIMLLPQTKTVLVYSTVGQNKKEIQTDAVTWGQLRAALLDNGISPQGMKAVIGQTQVSLDLDEAQIPESNFTLFLVPSKVESGYDWDDDDNNDDDDYSDSYDGPVYGKSEAIEDLTDAKAKISKVLQFLGDPNANVSSKPSDPETAKLDDEAQEIMRKMRR